MMRRIVYLVDSMIMVTRPAEKPRVKRMDTIINAAEKVFAEKDFSKATIAEIAKLASVADGTIYEYFTSKEDILQSIAVKRFSTYLADVAEAFEIKNPLRKLRQSRIRSWKQRCLFRPQPDPCLIPAFPTWWDL